MAECKYALKKFLSVTSRTTKSLLTEPSGFGNDVCQNIRDDLINVSVYFSLS